MPEIVNWSVFEKGFIILFIGEALKWKK